MRLCLLVMSQSVTIKSHQHGCLNMSKDNTDRHKVDGRKPTRLTQRTTSNLGMLRVGVTVFSRKVYSNWLSMTNAQP